MKTAEVASEQTKKELEQLKSEVSGYREAKQQSQQTKPTPYVQKQYKTDDRTYFGEMNAEGQRCGRALLRWTNGDTEGESKPQENETVKSELDVIFEETMKEWERLGTETTQLRASKQAKLIPYVHKQIPNGTYFGETNERGQRHGRGLFKSTDSSVFYFGDWKNNKICGKGVGVDEDGIYEGDWLDGQHHGRGVTHWVKDRLPKKFAGESVGILVYDGTFRGDKKCGKGSAVYSDGCTYEGEWDNDLFHGQGEIRWPEGDKYKGKFENGKKSGYGTYWYANGERYEGNWRNDLKHGDGVYHFCESDPRDIYRGETRDSEMYSKGIMEYKDGSTYRGYFVNYLFEEERKEAEEKRRREEECRRLLEQSILSRLFNWNQ